MELDVRVADAHGLHARPAAAFVQLAASFKSQIQVYNRTAGRGPVPATSILSVLTLGVNCGDTVTLKAEGEDAQQALEALSRLLRGDTE